MGRSGFWDTAVGLEVIDLGYINLSTTVKNQGSGG